MYGRSGGGLTIPKRQSQETMKEQVLVYECFGPSVVVMRETCNYNKIILTLQMLPCPREQVVKNVEGSLLFGLTNCT